MKIAYVCNEYPPQPHGGIGTFVYSMAHGMKVRGHQVIVVGWGAHFDERDDNGIRVITITSSRIPFIAWYFNRKKLADWLSREAANGMIDIIETCDFQGPLIHKIENFPVVVRLHLSDTSIRKNSKTKFHGMTSYCEKKQLSIHRDWIAVSHYALDLTRDTFNLEPLNFKVIYSPVYRYAQENAESLELPAKFVLFVGGMVSKRKGALVLAKSACIFLKNNRDVHLVFVGSLENEEGIPIDQVIRNILGTELSRRILFLGRLTRSQVLSVMGKATVFAYPSTLETFGLVIAEAMLEGCPVVVCAIGPNPEFVEHEKTGLMITSNDPQDLAAAIERLLKDPALATSLSEQALTQVKIRFSLEKSIDESLEFYRKRIKVKTEETGWKKLVELTSVLKFPKNIFKRIFPGIYSKLRLCFHLENRLYRIIVRRQGLVVRDGPFKGLKYISDSRGSRFIPKLLGSYELELHPILEKVIMSSPTVIIDIGCAEGYYAVGLSRLLPKTLVYAYDSDPGANERCLELARLNGVADRIHIRGECDVKELKKLRLKNAFILCDCEGYERELLNPDNVPELRDATLLVELHEMLSEGLTQKIVSRFHDTHEMTFIDIQKRDPKHFPSLKALSKEMQDLALYERELLDWAPQQWLYMVPIRKDFKSVSQEKKNES